MCIDLSIGIPDRKAALASNVSLDKCKLSLIVTAICIATQEVIGASVLYAPNC